MNRANRRDHPQGSPPPRGLSHQGASASRGKLWGNRLFAPGRSHWLEVVLVTAVLLAVFCSDISSVEFHFDESDWIATSSVFEAFVRGKFRSPVWAESYWTLTQPPVARYVIGLGRSLGGYRLSDLNKPWDYRLDAVSNQALGAMPSPGLLWWSRLSMAVAAVTSIVIIFALIRTSSGRLAGYLWAFLCAVNPYLLCVLRRAMSESALLLGIALAMLIAHRAFSSWGRAVDSGGCEPRAILPSLAWVTLTGFFCGLAGAAKLNGLSAVTAGIGLCVWMAVAKKAGCSTPIRLGFVLLAGLLMLCGAVAGFVGLNPFLFPDPLRRTVQMFQHRLMEMGIQQTSHPTLLNAGLQFRLKILYNRIFQSYASLRFSGSNVVGGLFALVGLGWLARAALGWHHRSVGSGAGVVLLFFGAASAIPPLATPLDWDRYFLLPVVFSTSLIAVGLAQVARLLWKLAGR